MVATIAAGTTAAYYTKQTEYYLGAREPAGRWISRMGDFGVVNGAEVARDQFERLHAALDERGRELLSNTGGKLERVAGFDLTLSAPKSVSLAWALATPELRAEIEAAQQQAAEATIAFLERHAAFCRRGRNGVRLEPVSLTVACFQHGEARPVKHDDGKVFADPNLHQHLVILSLARRADGTVGRLDGRQFFAWKMAAGAAYHAALSANFQKIGFKIADIGKNGTFEIAGVPRDLRRYFSARRRDVERILSAEGLTTSDDPARAAEIALRSRSAKIEQPTDRFELWAKEAERLGVDLDRFTPALRTGRDLSEKEREKAIAERVAAVPRQLTEHESVFENRKLYAAVAASLVGTGIGAERIDAEVDRLRSSGAVVALGRDGLGQPLYSTAEMIAIERDLVRLSQQLVRARHPSPSPKLLASICTTHGLTGEQADAVLAAGAAGAVVVFEGAAGAGKTTALAALVEGFRQSDTKVLGAAQAWRIVQHQLQDELGLEARAIDSWIALAKSGRRFLDRDTVLVVDEAGLLSSRQMHAVLSEVARAQAKVVLVGDRAQLQAIGAGPGLQIVASVVETARVETIVRQRDAWARTAVTDFAKGRAMEGLQAYVDRGLVSVGKGSKATITKLVDASLDAPTGTKLLIAKTNVEVRAINEEVRARLQAEGKLSAKEIAIRSVTPSGHTQDIHVAVGDEVRFLVRQDSLGVINGTVGTVSRVEAREDGNHRVSARVGERRIRFELSDLADANGRVRLTHAYASTIYGVQGLTCDYAFVLLGPAMNRHDAYVAASRARIRTDFCIDQHAVDIALRAELPLSERGNAAISADDRLAWLSERLSRVQIKSCTLDPRLANAEQTRSLAREQAWELDHG